MLSPGCSCSKVIWLGMCYDVMIGIKFTLQAQGDQVKVRETGYVHYNLFLLSWDKMPDKGKHKSLFLLGWVHPVMDVPTN